MHVKYQCQFPQRSLLSGSHERKRNKIEYKRDFLCYVVQNDGTAWVLSILLTVSD